MIDESFQSAYTSAKLRVSDTDWLRHLVVVGQQVVPLNQQAATVPP